MKENMKEKIFSIGVVITGILFVIISFEGCLGWFNPDGSGRGPIENSLYRK